MKKLLLGIMILVALVATSFSALASSYITEVDVNGVEMTSGKVLYVERGETLDIRAELKGASAKNVRMSAEVASGYEFEEVIEFTPVFDIESGVSYVKRLTLELPDDMEASKDYTLTVEVKGDNGELDEESYLLRIKEKRHLIDIQDVMFSPGLSVKAGDPLFVKVRIENMGDREEKDIKVEVSIPELGLGQRSYIDKLEVEDDDSSSSNTLYLQIPDSANKGNYEVKVSVEYNRGHDVTSKSFTLTIDGAIVSTGELMISPEATSKEVAKGQGVAYKISLANLQAVDKTYTFDVTGEEAWATGRADPSTLTIKAGQTGEVVAYLAVKEDATAGDQVFTLKIMESGKVIQQLKLNAKVVEKAAGAAGWGSVKTGLEIGFIVLLIILVILGIIIAASKTKKEEAPEAETYY